MDATISQMYKVNFFAKQCKTLLQQQLGEQKTNKKEKCDCIDNSHQLHRDHRNIGNGPLSQQDGASPPATGASAVAGKDSL